jgi:hypothetical protein
MASRVNALASGLCWLLLTGCGPVQDPRDQELPDLCPPCVLSVRTIGSNEIELSFDEEAELVPESLMVRPELSIDGAPQAAMRVILRVGSQTPGTLYTLEATARDARGNAVSFIAELYGYNPRVPRVVINECTPRGSDTHPDILELKVLSDGDMGGLVLYQGTPGDYTDRLIFPSFAVHAGTFILVHFKPSGDPGEVDETSDTAASKGIDASDTAFDFWVPEGGGLGGNNGVLSLYIRPGGEIVDGLLYSNRNSDSDAQYRGFGTASTLARAEELVADGGWRISGTRVAPEDAVNPDGSTATRSLCRSSGSGDTDRREDWHIVPTRKSTFGSDNSDEVYSP